jgi:hypothetical protein
MTGLNMKQSLLRLLVCASILSGRAGMAQPFRTCDTQVTLDTNVVPVVAAGGPESRASSEDLQGHWGKVVEGFQLSLRFVTNTFMAGGPVVAYAFLRNVTKQWLEYVVDTGKPCPGCDFRVWDSHGRELPARNWRSGGWGSARTHNLQPLVQDRYWIRLDKAFHLHGPSEYRVCARAFAVARDGTNTVEITSGTAVIGITTEQDDASTWGPVTNNAQMSISVVQPGSVSGRLIVIGGGTNPMGGYVTNPITVKRELKPREPFNLWVRIRNLSTNEALWYFRARAPNTEESVGLACVVVSPSGKDVSPKKHTDGGSGAFGGVDPGKTTEFEFALSQLCKLEEMGTYKITAKRAVDVVGKSGRGFVLTSNTLCVRVVPAE